MNIYIMKMDTGRSLLLLLILLILTLTACASKYGPLPNNSEHKGGYQEIFLPHKMENEGKNLTVEGANKSLRYAVKYQGTTSDTKEYIEAFWQQRANELCPEGFHVERYSAYFKYGTIRSPVNGMMVNLGTQQPIVHGIIVCL